MRQLAKRLMNDVRVRVAILLVIAAIIGWQFLPVWLQFAIVMYTGWPVVAAGGLAVAVGFLTLNWRVAVLTGGCAFAFGLLASAIAIDASERRCTAYATYIGSKGIVALYRVGSWFSAYIQAEIDRLRIDEASLEAEKAEDRMCFTLADWRASWR
jgi:hypothetical protein